MQRRIAPAVPSVHLSVICQQQLDCWNTLPHDCMHQWCYTMDITLVHVGASGNKLPHPLPVPLL